MFLNCANLYDLFCYDHHIRTIFTPLICTNSLSDLPFLPAAFSSTRVKLTGLKAHLPYPKILNDGQENQFAEDDGS
jgi:hypothetical protein